MPTMYRFPVLVWKDHEGYHTATLVEWEETPAVSRKSADALEMISDYLGWLYEQQPWRPAPEFQHARLTPLPVLVRPEYRAEDRVFPCPQDFSLRVWVVQGENDSGLFLASLPTLQVRFHFHDLDALPDLVFHYASNKLQGLTPQALARHLPPAEAWLEEVVVRVPARTRAPTTSHPFPALGAVAESLEDRQLRKQFGRAREREAEVALTASKLGQERANLLIVGEPGSGKTTVLVEAVNRLHRTWASEGKSRVAAPPRQRVWLSAGNRLIAGMKFLGQWEQRCEEIIKELNRLDGILCCDSLLELVRAGGSSPHNSIAAFLLPFLQRGELRLAAEATAAELDACRRLLPGFADLFQVVVLQPLDRPRAVAILDHHGQALAQASHLKMARGVTDLVYHLFRRFAPYHAFPGKALQFLDDVFERSRQGGLHEVAPEQIVDQFVRGTGLPGVFLRDEWPLERSRVVEEFQGQVLGQDEGVQAAADLVNTFKASLNDPGRPVGVMLLCGPTGVGKTEMARALARYFFGHSESDNGLSRLVRLDMSEYAGPDAAERLMLQPDGEPSELIRKLRQQPFCVVLLDEIEKADARVYDVLLSVFDEGRLTDRFGRVTSFRSAVIVLTSNLGASQQQAFGFVGQADVPYAAEARAFFRPEFFNRIDAVVTFRPLGRETIHAIALKELEEVARREGIARRRLRLTWTNRLVEFVASEGFDPRYGARPLQRKLDHLITSPLAKFLLQRPELREAEIVVDRDDSGLVSMATKPL